MLLPGVGEAGQRRLGGAHAVVVGCGALGTVSGQLLVRAGVGHVTLVDRDVVERTNLQRQFLFTEADADAGRPKALAAAERLVEANPTVRVRPLVRDVTAANAESLLSIPDAPRADVLVDGTDSFETRLLLNDLAVKHGLPLVYGGAVATRGMLATILPAAPGAPWEPGPCLRCLFDAAPPPGASATCDTAGVLGPVTSAVAALQAAEALKVLLGAWERVDRCLTVIDQWTGEHPRVT